MSSYCITRAGTCEEIHSSIISIAGHYKINVLRGLLLHYRRKKLAPAGIAKIKIPSDIEPWSLSVERERWYPYHMPWEFTYRRKYTANCFGEKWFPTKKKIVALGRWEWTSFFEVATRLLWKGGYLKQAKETRGWGGCVNGEETLWREKYFKIKRKGRVGWKENQTI